jgi:hypothetical protein
VVRTGGFDLLAADGVVVRVTALVAAMTKRNII